MGSPLTFQESLELQRRTDKQALWNAIIYHKQRIMAALVIILVIYGPLLYFINSSDSQDDHYLSEPTSPGQQLREYVEKGPTRLYLLSFPLTLAALGMAGFLSQLTHVAQATMQRRTGRLDFLYPAPLPSHSLFYYQVRNMLRLASTMPILLLLLLVLMLGYRDMGYSLFLRLTYVFTCGLLTLGGLNIFYRSSLTMLAPHQQKKLKMGALMALSPMLLILLAAQVSSRPFLNAMEEVLLLPLVRAYLFYPAFMSSVISWQAPLHILLLKGLVLLFPSILLFYHFRYREHKLYEITLRHSLWNSMGMVGPIWMPYSMVRDHREIAIQPRLRLFNRAWPPLPARGHGLRAYLTMRSLMALRGPALGVLVGYWFFILGLFFILFEALTPDDGPWLEGLLLAAVMFSPIGFMFLFMALPQRSLCPAQSGMDRTLPLSTRSRYLALLGAGTYPLVLFCAALVGCLLWLSYPDLDELGTFVTAESEATLFIVLVILWMGTGPTGTFWWTASAYSPESPPLRSLLLVILSLGIVLLHLWLLVVFGIMATLVVSTIILVSFLSLGYHCFAKWDVRV